MTYTVNDRPATAPRVQPPVAPATATVASATDHRSTADLVKLAAEQISTLVRDELKLAQVELTQKGKRAGRGVGMFGGAGLVALYGVGALLAAAIIGLATVMPAWLSALLIGVVLLAVAGILALMGKSQVSKAGPPVPQDAVASVKADINTITHSVKDRGHR
ncbi:phage holin family protein [Dactylosporangium aurantiacum]|uniref:Phage holin family protein n=1 Tax=Dactylosporangium aurantiacum TaxID=35754 RepID=A0A9Q9MP50_9ACTN|nr:phage holin family protein [Dactylosporangium aurantiacum]MDG6109742.1 phage holin family protein [Dactylosporangium aurantiacum]UWZ56322.1 phage holin family protein [Dactylosporangium aurantiacum]